MRSSVRNGAFFGVHLPVTARPSFVPGTENNPGDLIDVLTLGTPFYYMIPSFDVLRVELRQMKVAVIQGGVDTTLDLFVRNDPALCRSYPAKMTIKDFLVVDVREPNARSLRCA